MNHVGRENDKGHQQGAMRAALDAFLGASNPASGSGSGSWDDAPPYSNREAAFNQLLALWTGTANIDATATTGAMNARHAAILTKVYGGNYQNATYDQAVSWELTFRRLSETYYASLAAQTHVTDDYALIDWQVHANINEEIGHLDAVTAVFKQRMAEAIAADAAASSAATLAAGAPITISTSYDAVRTGINEFGRVLRGLDLTRSSTYFAFREAFTVEAPAGLDNLAANDAALRTFAFDTAGIATSIYTTYGRGSNGTDAMFVAPTVVGGSNWGGFWGDVRRRMNGSAAPRSCRRTYHSRPGITCRAKKLLRRTA